MPLLAFNAVHARAKPIPSAAQIALADAEVQQDFLFMFARVRFPTDFPQSEEQREERLFTFYNRGGKTAIKSAVCLICEISDSIWADTNQEFHDVQPELAGLLVSIITRPLLMHNHPIPQFDGALLRVTFKQKARRNIFDAGKANQVRVLLKDNRRLRSEQPFGNASKASATPSADSIATSDLFEGVFDNTFQDPDTRYSDA
jgi:hypothetical protein